MKLERIVGLAIFLGLGALVFAQQQPVDCVVTSVGKYANGDSKPTARCKGVVKKGDVLTFTPPAPPPAPAPPPPVVTPPPPSVVTPPPATTPSTLPLVQPSSLVYQGSFRVPFIPDGQGGFGWSLASVAFAPGRGSLFLSNHDQYQQVGEISIPTPGVGPLASLPVATLLQPIADVNEGKFPGYRDGGVKLGGLLPWGNRLITASYVYYDANGGQVLSHTATGFDFSITGDVVGPVKLASPKTGFISGYMTDVPQEWQALLGGPALTGNCCVPIISRTSYGPAVSAFDPTQIGMVDPVPTVPLLYYPDTNPLSRWDGSQRTFNGSTRIRGVVIPNGMRSVLFFGRQGLGTFCYGYGTTDQTLDNTVSQPGPRYPSLDGTFSGDGVTHLCYDPLVGAGGAAGKGNHAYPYVHQVWAYDLNDLAAAKAGALKPWQVKPYAVWTLPLPTGASDNADNLGASYDRATGRLFLAQAKADGNQPVIHVFTLQP